MRLIEMGHARALLSLDDDLQVQAAREVVRKRLSVRETENLVRRLQQSKKAKRPPPDGPRHPQPAEPAGRSARRPRPASSTRPPARASWSSATTTPTNSKASSNASTSPTSPLRQRANFGLIPGAPLPLRDVLRANPKGWQKVPGTAVRTINCREQLISAHGCLERVRDRGTRHLPMT